MSVPRGPPSFCGVNVDAQQEIAELRRERDALVEKVERLQAYLDGTKKVCRDQILGFRDSLSAIVASGQVSVADVISLRDRVKDDGEYRPQNCAACLKRKYDDWGRLCRDCADVEEGKHEAFVNAKLAWVNKLMERP